MCQRCWTISWKQNKKLWKSLHALVKEKTEFRLKYFHCRWFIWAALSLQQWFNFASHYVDMRLLCSTVLVPVTHVVQIKYIYTTLVYVRMRLQFCWNTWASTVWINSENCNKPDLLENAIAKYGNKLENFPHRYK